MIRFPEMWYWVVIVVVVILAAGVTTLYSQTNDVSVSEETKPLDTPNKVDPSTKAESQQGDQALPSPIRHADLTPDVEHQRLLNDLRKEYLDTRAEAINWWLQFTTIVLAFFGIVVVVLGYFGIKSFRELEADAKKHVEEIKEHHTQSKSHLEEITSENIDDPDRAPKVEEAIRDVQSDPEPLFMDKVIAEIYTLQREGKIEDVIEKWRSIANIAEGNDNELAARAWLSIRYFLVGEEDRRDAYNKAMSLDPNYTRTYMSQYRAKYSNLSPHGVVVGIVLRYFNDPKFEKFSAVQEYQIESGRYRADVVLQDEKGQLTTIVECMVNEHIPESTMTHLKEHFRHSGAQFGLLAAGPELSRWTFLKILENEITGITRSQFEEEFVESGSS